jgi:hypothetical protein
VQPPSLLELVLAQRSLQPASLQPWMMWWIGVRHKTQLQPWSLLQLWFHHNKQRLQMLRCSGALFNLAFRLVRVKRQEEKEDGSYLDIVKRCLKDIWWQDMWWRGVNKRTFYDNYMNR